MARVLLPLPDVDFDTTEVAVPWKVLREAGHEVVFATERAGTVAACDPLLLTGVLLGQLGAEAEPKALYAEMCGASEYRDTVAWADVDVTRFDALLLPGGHAPGMRQYLGSAVLHQKVAAFAKTGKPLGAICHGPLVLARAGVVKGRKLTCLPKYLERVAWYATAWKLGRYYRTYDAYVEDELRAAGAEFVRGPTALAARGTRTDDRPAFVVQDDNLVTARWPGDAWLFARKLTGLLA
jgi:putative intracellular protease/amidase